MKATVSSLNGTVAFTPTGHRTGSGNPGIGSVE